VSEGLPEEGPGRAGHLSRRKADLNFDLYLYGLGGARWRFALSAPFARDQTAGAVGAGFRYLMARQFGLYAGVDVARGPEDTVVYQQVGSAWN